MKGQTKQSATAQSVDVEKLIVDAENNPAQFFLYDDHGYPIYEETNQINPYRRGDYISLEGENQSTHEILSVTHNIKKSKVLIIIMSFFKRIFKK